MSNNKVGAHTQGETELYYSHLQHQSKEGIRQESHNKEDYTAIPFVWNEYHCTKCQTIHSTYEKEIQLRKAAPYMLEALKEVVKFNRLMDNMTAEEMKDFFMDKFDELVEYAQLAILKAESK